MLCLIDDSMVVKVATWGYMLAGNLAKGRQSQSQYFQTCHEAGYKSHTMHGTTHGNYVDTVARL